MLSGAICCHFYSSVVHLELNALSSFLRGIALLQTYSLLLLVVVQKIQKGAARVVTRKRKSEHSTPLLKQLHWLPVEAGIQYKVATLADRHFEGTLPLYLSSVLHAYQPSRSEKIPKVPKTNLKSAGNSCQVPSTIRLELSTILTSSHSFPLDIQNWPENIPV